MAIIEIRNDSGEVDQRELRRRMPIMIGSHSSNDVVIDEPGVAPMHCRISWGNGKFEAVAASSAPLDVNGTQKQRADLAPGDTLRFGSFDLVYWDSEPPIPGAVPQIVADAISEFGSEIDVFEVETGPESIPELPVEEEAAEQKEEPGSHKKPSVEQRPKTKSLSKDSPLDSERLRQALRSRQSRPGEEDLLRSPLLISLTFAACALALASAVFYFIAFRQTAQQAFEVARQAYDEGNYRVSIESLQKFITNYPGQPQTDQARQLLGFSKVQQLIEGGAPQYSEGLMELNTLIENQKENNDFELLFPDFVKLARTTALGAAEAAGRQFTPELLEIARQASRVMTTYSPRDAIPTEALNQIEQRIRESQATILKNDVYQDHLKQIDTAFTAGDTLQALQLRRDLLTRYPAFLSDKSLTEQTRKVLVAEQDSVKHSDLNQASTREDHNWPDKQLTVGFLARTRTDEVATGQALIMLAHDCCYGVEMATGQLLWRRVTGVLSPFFPREVDNRSAIVLFNTRFQELELLDHSTGQLIWRQSIPEGVSGAPAFLGDTLYLSTKNGRILAIDVASGTITESLTFSQPVGAPVVLEDSQRLVVAGNREVLYVLGANPLTCLKVFNLEHPAESIRAPLLPVASYLLAIVNGNNKATLELLTTGDEQLPMKRVGSASVTGRVLDSPALRGQDLFVPSSGARVSTFSLSDEPGQPPIASGPVYVTEGGYPGATYLLTGPDRQLWMATGALSRLRLSTEALQVDGDAIGTGSASQPLQFVSGSLFHARRRPATGAIIMTRTDRDEMKSDWQLMMGSPIAAWTTTESSPAGICVVNDAGQTFLVPAGQPAGKDFQLIPGTRLPLPGNLKIPLLPSTLKSGRVAVAAGGEEPRYWVLSPAGQIESSGLLKNVPQVPACELKKALLFPLAGSIQVIPATGGPAIQGFMLPTGSSEKWVSISAVGEEEVAAVTESGKIILLKLNTGNPAALTESSRIDLGQPVTHPARSNEGFFVVADQSQRVSLFQSERLTSIGSRTFSGTVSGPLHIAAKTILVEEDRTRLHALETATDLPIRWTLPLPGSSIAGVTERGGTLVVALQSGQLHFIDPLRGTVTKTIETHNTLTIGPFRNELDLFVGADDGTLIRIPASEFQ